MSPQHRRRAAEFAASLFLGVFALAVPLSAASQQRSGPDPVPPDQHSASTMSEADTARIRAQRSLIAAEAAFFGYDLALPGWQYTQAVCPESPSFLLLQYRRTGRSGAESLFTAAVPRGSGRVLVVPVLYRNATPFQSPVGSKRSLSVFNRIVSPAAAEGALKTDGPWLQLALCYAEIVGAEPRVPRDTNEDPALVRAPLPTLLISEGNGTASVSFTDRSSSHGYAVWNVVFDRRGRATAATAAALSDYIAHVVKGKQPEERPFPSGSAPKALPQPPASAPEAKPLPQ